MPPTPPILSLVVAPRARRSWLQRDAIDELTVRASGGPTGPAVGAGGEGGSDVRVSGHHGLLLLDLVGPAGTLRVLDRVAADPALVAGLWLGLPPRWEFAAERLAERARRTDVGLQVADHPDEQQAAPAVAAVLDLHMTILRDRSRSEWRAADALHEYKTVTAASEALGISHQAVSKAVARGAVRTTDATIDVLTHLLQR